MLSLLLAVLLIIASGVNVFATETIDTSELVETNICFGDGVIVRGTNLPSDTIPLYSGVTSTGTAYFSASVYSNYMYSDHGGSIKITLTNSSLSTVSSDVMYVAICYKNWWGGQVDVASVSFPVNGSGSYTFTGLNTNKSYFFQFYQYSYIYETTTSFSVTRGS